jgi:hypothetical protein
MKGDRYYDNKDREKGFYSFVSRIAYMRYGVYRVQDQKEDA